MSSEKISALTAATEIGADDLIHVVDVSDTTEGATGTNKKATGSLIKGQGAFTVTGSLSTALALNQALIVPTQDGRLVEVNSQGFSLQVAQAQQSISNGDQAYSGTLYYSGWVFASGDDPNFDKDFTPALYGGSGVNGASTITFAKLEAGDAFACPSDQELQYFEGSISFTSAVRQVLFFGLENTESPGDAYQGAADITIWATLRLT